MKATRYIPFRGGGGAAKGEAIPEGALSESEIMVYLGRGDIDDGKPKTKEVLPAKESGDTAQES